MIKYIKNLDSFNKNIILLFLGTSVISFFNLLYQLLIAHRFSPGDFAALNSLLSILVIISSPLTTLQLAVAKYSAEFRANNQIAKIRVLLSVFLKKTLIFALFTIILFFLASNYIASKLKIDSSISIYILAILLGLSWIMPVFMGGLQGLEFFNWFVLVSLIGGIVKLASAFLFIYLGWGVVGALGGFLVASALGIFIVVQPFKKIFASAEPKEIVSFNEIYKFFVPVALSSLCFMGLVNFDMVLVKYFFSQNSSGVYSLAQMVGKVFLFLPGAISIAMFPRTSGLNARNLDTAATLKKSLWYGACLCVIAVLIYNLFPSVILKILTGKTLPESILLGRLFSVSMSFFSLVFILISYFLSIRDFRFLKYLIFLSLLQLFLILFIHQSLFQVQIILSLNAILLFFINLSLAYQK